MGRLVIRRFESRLNLLFFVVSWPRPPTRAFYHSIKLLKRKMCELFHQSLLFESQLTLLFSVTYFRCFSMTDVPAVLKVILCHFSRNDLTLYIYYSLVVPFHSHSLTERRQPPIKSHHFISLCAANHVSVSRLKAARVHFNYDIKARGTTCLPLLA